MKTLTPEQKAKRVERRRKRIEQLRANMRKDVAALKVIIYGKAADKSK